jgi:hypothetical protein
MKQVIPPSFQRKMLADALVNLETSRFVVDFDEYKKLKARQKRAYRECEIYQFPSKKE